MPVGNANHIQENSMTAFQFGIPKEGLRTETSLWCVIWDTPLNKHQIPDTSICQRVVKCNIHHQKNAHHKTSPTEFDGVQQFQFQTSHFFHRYIQVLNVYDLVVCGDRRKSRRKYQYYHHHYYHYYHHRYHPHNYHLVWQNMVGFDHNYTANSGIQIHIQ